MPRLSAFLQGELAQQAAASLLAARLVPRGAPAGTDALIDQAEPPVGSRLCDRDEVSGRPETGGDAYRGYGQVRIYPIAQERPPAS